MSSTSAPRRWRRWSPTSSGRRRRTALGALALLAALALAGGHPLGAAGAASSSEVARCIRDRSCHRTYVVAHRANGFGAPENSRDAVRRAVEASVPGIKIDVRLSRDGEIFVVHDGKLDRTTSLQGRIEGFSAAELDRARLDNGETLPRFADLYALARGRSIMVVGFKNDAVERVADWIAANGSFDDVVFFVNTGEEMRAAATAKARHPEMIVMVRLLDTRVTVESTRQVFNGLPEIFHTERVGARPVAELHALGAKVFMNAVPWEDYVWPVNYLGVGWLLGSKLDFILTDEPLALMRRLG
jgi:glycerophosphoryl diester phosphodiesterase